MSSLKVIFSRTGNFLMLFDECGSIRRYCYWLHCLDSYMTPAHMASLNIIECCRWTVLIERLAFCLYMNLPSVVLVSSRSEEIHPSSSFPKRNDHHQNENLFETIGSFLWWFFNHAIFNGSLNLTPSENVCTSWAHPPVQYSFGAGKFLIKLSFELLVYESGNNFSLPTRITILLRDISL